MSLELFIEIKGTLTLHLVKLQSGRRGRTYTFKAGANTRDFKFSKLRPGVTYEGNVTAKNRFGKAAPTPFMFTTLSTVCNYISSPDSKTYFLQKK